MSERSLEAFFYEKPEYEIAARSRDLVFTLDYADLYWYNPELGIKLLEEPDKAFNVIRSSLKPVENPKGEYVEKEIRVVNLLEPTEIRSIESYHVEKLVQVEGIITSVSFPYPEPTLVAFTCPRCGYLVEEPQDGIIMRFPKKCTGPDCRNNRFSPDDMDFKYTKNENIQRAEIQETPEALQPGAMPESLNVVLRGSHIRTLHPGDRAKIVGKLKQYPTKPRKMEFIWVLEANSIKIENKGASIDVTEEDLQEFKKITENEDTMGLLVRNFATGIYGWGHVKEALLLALFGGVPKVKGDTDVRGNMNILLVGDPATSKSQLLRYCHKVSYRSVFSSGRGITGVGLTCAAIKEGERYVLKAGSMALADMGVCIIDEGEKMNKEDRESIHTPMEQQIIPVHKGGLNTTLNARCATIMACNPTDGRYNIYKTISENIKDFPESLLSRFDFIFVMPDVIDKDNDPKIIARILGRDKNEEKKEIPFNTFKKYIAYSKRFTPKIPEAVLEYLEKVFMEKRSQPNESGLTISWRQAEALERACEARARAHHREEVTMEDAEAVVKLFEIYVRATWTDPYTGKIDMNVYEGMPANSRTKQSEYVPRIIEQMYRDGKGQVGVDGQLYVKRVDLIDEMKRLGNLDTYIANEVLTLAIKKDLVWEPRDGGGRVKLAGGRNRMLGDEPTTLNTS